MCIICASPKGAEQPTTEQIKTMFNRNAHGAGYMVARNGKVEIHKGFMILGDLLKQLEREHFTADDSVVYHFRISTQAGVKPQMTQPFPMARKGSELEALDVTCNIGVAHNGIIPMTSTGDKRFSDTALFVGLYLPRILRDRHDLYDPMNQRMIEELIHSKMVIMDETGYIATIGQFIHADNGLIFSNRTYEKITTPTVKYGYPKGGLLWYDTAKEVYT